MPNSTEPYYRFIPGMTIVQFAQANQDAVSEYLSHKVEAISREKQNRGEGRQSIHGWKLLFRLQDDNDTLFAERV